MVHIMEFWGLTKHKEMHPMPIPSPQLMYVDHISNNFMENFEWWKNVLGDGTYEL
jgi:lipopolysaccharide biosynthesis protein